MTFKQFFNSPIMTMLLISLWFGFMIFVFKLGIAILKERK